MGKNERPKEGEEWGEMTEEVGVEIGKGKEVVDGKSRAGEGRVFLGAMWEGRVGQGRGQRKEEEDAKTGEGKEERDRESGDVREEEDVEREGME